jgi:hypothetical protein
LVEINWFSAFYFVTFEFFQLKTVKFGRCDRTPLAVIKLKLR